MKPILLPLALLTVMTAGCAASPSHTIAPHAPPAAPVAETKAAPANEAELAPVATLSATTAANESPARQPGDFVVYKFSGSFRKTPATLTERVVARREDQLTIDMTLEDTSGKRSIRVRMSDAAATRGEIAGVARLESGKEIAAGLEAYDAFLAGTSLTADANEATLGSEDVNVDVGGSAFAGKKTSFRVRVGKRSAILSTIESASMPWGDLGGEIKADNGKILYHAEIVELGHAAAPAAAIANSDLDD